MVSGALSILISQFLIIPAGFITSVFLARHLGPINFGLFALASRLITWLEWTGTSAFAGATVKFVSQEKDWQTVGTTAVQLYFITGITLGMSVWLLSSPLSRLFDEPAVAEYLKLFAIDIPIFSLFCANRSILVGRGLFKERARITAAYWVVRLVLIVLFVSMGLSVKGAIMGSIGASVIALGMSICYVRPSLFSGAAFSRRRLCGFAAPLFMASLSQRIFRLDLFALKALGGSAAHAGFYSAALNLSIPPNVFATSLSPPLLSTLSRLVSKGEMAEAKEIGVTAIRSVFWIMPFAAMTAGASSEIICFVFGEKFSPAGPILALLIFSAMGLLTIMISRTIFIASDKPVWSFAMTGPMVPLALIGHLILVPRIGPVGAALVTTLVACSGAIASLCAVYRIWRIYPPVSTLLKSVFCSITAFGLASLWPVSGLMIVLKIIIIVLVILLTFFLLREFTAREMNWLRLMLRRKTSDASKTP